MKRILPLYLLLLLGIYAQAQEKIFIAEDIYGDKYYLYPSTIKKGYNDYLTVWLEIIYAQPQYYSKNKYYTSSKDQWLIDCQGMKLSLISGRDYSKSGKVIDSFYQSERKAANELKLAIPDTIIWNIVKKTCNRY